MTTPELDQAREWAKDVHPGHHPEAVATAKVIASLPDQWIDADKVRELLDKWAANPFPTSDEVAVLNDVEALIAPPLQTLADMTPEERTECEWMQCDHPALDEPGVILQVWGNGCRVVSREGSVETEALNHVTPRPDLPRLEWPDSGENGSVSQRLSAWDELVEHPFFIECFDGEKSLIEEMLDKLDSHMGNRPVTDLPCPEDVPAGEVWKVQHEGLEWVGVRANDLRIPWSITNMDGLEYRDVEDFEITLVSRLVPEVTP